MHHLQGVCTYRRTGSVNVEPPRAAGLSGKWNEKSLEYDNKNFRLSGGHFDLNSRTPHGPAGCCSRGQ